jgi:hypothetical protein
MSKSKLTDAIRALPCDANRGEDHPYKVAFREGFSTAKDAAAKLAEMKEQAWDDAFADEIAENLKLFAVLGIDQEALDNMDTHSTALIVERIKSLQADRTALRAELDNVACQIGNEGPHTLEHVIACGMVGKFTTVIGRARLKQLGQVESRVESLTETARKAMSLIDQYLGDTDPPDPDHPLVQACAALAAIVSGEVSKREQDCKTNIELSA